MKYVGNVQSQANAEVYATASGTLPNGKPVIVNSDGSVSLISLIPEGFGAETTITNSATMTGATFDSNSNRVVVVYREGSNGYGTAIVGTVSDRTISFGTAVTYESASSNYNAITFDSNSNKVVIAYQDSGNSGYTTSIVGTVDPSDNSITFGTAVVVKSAYANWISATFDSNSNKVVVAIDRYAFVGTVSGTGISFGSQVDYGAGATSHIASTFDTNSNKVVLCYTKGGFCKSRVGTVSGTGISFGTEVFVVPFPNSGSENGITFDSNSNKVVAVTLSTNNLTKAAVGTVSGTNISYGTAANVSSETYGEMNRVVFDSSTNKIIAFWKDGGNSYRGTTAVGTVSGTSISFAPATVFDSANTGDIFATFDSNSNKTVVVYYDNSKFRASVFGFESTTLTTENYIGITNGVVDYDEGPASFGSETEFSGNNNVLYVASAYDPDTNKTVIVYRDTGDGNKGKAVVATVSGTSVSFGTAAVFESGNHGDMFNDICYDTNSNKFVIVFNSASNSTNGTAVVGTVSGTDISFGNKTVFQSNLTSQNAIVFDSNANKVVVSYTNNGNSNYGTAIVGTVSGTSISFGTAVVYNSAATFYGNVTFDSNSNKTVHVYLDQGNSSKGTAIVGTVSGTGISFGSEANFTSSAVNVAFNCSFDPDNNKVLVVYRDGGSPYEGRAIVGTVSGTSISFGTAVSTGNVWFTFRGIAYDTVNNQSVVMGSSSLDGGSSYSSVAQTATISGNSVVWGDRNVFNSDLIDADGAGNGAVYDSAANRVLISYSARGSDSYDGKSIVYKAAFDNTVRGSTASGSTAIIQAGGAISTLQTGLTPGNSISYRKMGRLALQRLVPQY